MQSTLIKNESTRNEVQPLHPLLTSTLFFFGLALLLATSAFVIHLDVVHNQSGIGENSLMEYLQEGYLLIVVALFATVGIKLRDQRGFAFLVSAFFSIVLIRELDSVFDQISHGFWKYPAWLMATMAIIYALSHKESSLQPLICYTKHRSFGLMLAGMATLLVFARIYGMSDLWQSIMQDSYIRPVKNLAEEGVELLAYSLVFFASTWYCLPELLKKKQ
ncbi:hypothetical protein C942_01554 [Photobacterium marinum]|uniref:Uncharacterized protein n=1 Tax=Photobacterium marinum TaxID=1056511 RepID=L8JJG5_9GAMM|nr:hypothetical protein [Photobacterium marinum]ELR67624.1 hypothetical protein C942_01554 [Photobacterium marinum]